MEDIDVPEETVVQETGSNETRPLTSHDLPRDIKSIRAS